MSDELAVASQAPTDAEIGVVVRRLAAAYEGNLRWRMRELKETAEEADRRARALDAPEHLSRVIDAATESPADQVSWSMISTMIESDPEAGWAVWERVKDGASEELESGHRA